MLKILKWAAFKAVGAWLVYATTVQQSDGAHNVLTVLIWFSFLVSLFLFTDKLKASIAKAGRTVPAWLSTGVSFGFSAVLLWHGFMVLGVLQFVAALFTEAATADALKESN